MAGPLWLPATSLRAFYRREVPHRINPSSYQVPSGSQRAPTRPSMDCGASHQPLFGIAQACVLKSSPCLQHKRPLCQRRLDTTILNQSGI